MKCLTTDFAFTECSRKMRILLTSKSERSYYIQYTENVSKYEMSLKNGRMKYLYYTYAHV